MSYSEKKKRINWGFIGLGRIAHKFAHDLLLSNTSNLYAVASRSLEKAGQFRDYFGAAKAYGSYHELMADPEVDIIYIATPHHLHYRLILDCIEHNKHVLCEKPMCVNALQVEQIIEKKAGKNLFVMEALWSRFIPSYLLLKEKIKERDLKILSLHADMTFLGVYDTSTRLFDPNLAGGSLLDCGIYPVSLAIDLLGLPDSIEAFSIFKNGVDASTAVMFQYPQTEKTAQLYSDFLSNTKTEAVLRAGKYSIVIPERWLDADGFYIKDENKIEKFKRPKVGFGYYHEISHVDQCLLKEKTESPVYPLSESLQLINQLDRIRRKINLVYPQQVETI